MSHSKFPAISFGIVVAFVCAANPAFAQRGGGSGGGGFHGGGGGGGFHSGGGGFHGGSSGSGGFHGSAGGGGGSHASGGFNGGGFRSGPSSSPRMGTGYSRSTLGTYGRPGVGPSVRSGSSAFTSYGSGRSGGGGQRPGYSSLSRSRPDGQWHSFGGPAAGRGSVTPGSQGRTSANPTRQTFGGARSTGGTHTARSFSGQGNQIWENARSAGPPRSPLNNHGNLNRFGPFRDNPRFGSPFRDRDRFEFGRGCWNCGFGWSFGFGWWPGWSFGGPWLGGWNWGWGPAWIDPVWGWAGYDYSSYPADYTIDDSYDGDYSYSTQPQNDAPQVDAPQNDGDDDAGAPPADEPYSTSYSSDAKIEMPVLLFMKNRSVYAASDYWVEDGKLHYMLSTGAEKMVDLNELDVRRTIAENADLGTQVTLTSRPSQSETPPEMHAPTSPTIKPRKKIIAQPSVRS